MLSSWAVSLSGQDTHHARTHIHNQGPSPAKIKFQGNFPVGEPHTLNVWELGRLGTLSTVFSFSSLWRGGMKALHPGTYIFCCLGSQCWFKSNYFWRKSDKISKLYWSYWFPENWHPWTVTEAWSSEVYLNKSFKSKNVKRGAFVLQMRKKTNSAPFVFNLFYCARYLQKKYVYILGACR